jgi:hypothetical protein
MADWVRGRIHTQYVYNFPPLKFQSVYRHGNSRFRSRTSILRIHLQKSISVYSHKGSVLLTYTQHLSLCHHKHHVSFQRYFWWIKYAYGASYLIHSKIPDKISCSETRLLFKIFTVSKYTSLPYLSISRHLPS